VTSLSVRRRHPLAGVVVLLLGLVVLGGLYAAFAPPSRAQGGSVDEDVEAGRKIFAVTCATCHGLGGQGITGQDGKVLGPSLVGVGAAAVDFQVGTGRMPMAQPGAQVPRKNVVYTEEQIRQLAAFVASLGEGPAIPDAEHYDPANGEAAEGGEIFRTNCASCHNFAGQGGALSYGKYAPSLTGVEPKYVYEAMLTGPQAMPVFSDDVMTPEQKASIIAYLQGVQEEPNPGGLGIGRIGPVSEGLWGWLVGIGALVGVAVWIGAKSS
jgi:ubiquinol-cytochrome c reductase cytochrome c subunit